MTKIRFAATPNTLLGVTDVVDVPDGADPLDALLAAAWDAVDLHVDVAVAGVTMPACMWGDVDHWSTDWAEKLGCDVDEVEERVAALLAAAVES